jgi:hypothetical protein
MTFSECESHRTSTWHSLAHRELGIHLLLQHSKLSGQRDWHTERARIELLRQLELSIENMKETCYGCIGLGHSAWNSATLVVAYASIYRKIFNQYLPYHLSSFIVSASDMVGQNMACEHDSISHLSEIDKLLLPSRSTHLLSNDDESKRKSTFDSEEACNPGKTLLTQHSDLQCSLKGKIAISLAPSLWSLYSTPQSYALVSRFSFIEQSCRPRNNEISKELALAAKAFKESNLELQEPLFNTMHAPESACSRLTDISHQTGILLIGLHSHSPQNYCHFLLDFLPSILLAVEDLSLIDSNKTLAISHSIEPQYARIYYQIAASNGWDIVEVPRYMSLFGSCKVFIPNLQHHPLGLDQQRSLRSTRQLFHVEHSSQSMPCNLCVYVRRPLGCRGIVNEKELIKLLSNCFSNRLVIFDSNYQSLSIFEQANLFASASVIVGPHGAGLSNIIFCRPQTLVVELVSARWYMPTFKKAADAADLRFTSLISPAGIGDNSGHFANIEVDLPKLSAVLACHE